jgi:hypothetical protein
MIFYFSKHCEEQTPNTGKQIMMHIFFSKTYWGKNHLAWIARQPNGNYCFATRRVFEFSEAYTPSILGYDITDLEYLGAAEELLYLTRNIDVPPEIQIKSPKKYKLSEC